MDVLLVVDMQEGLLQGKPKHDLSGVVERINRLAARVRERGGRVLFAARVTVPGAVSSSSRRSCRGLPLPGLLAGCTTRTTSPCP